MHSLAPETDVRAMNVVLDDARLENRGQTTVFSNPLPRENRGLSPISCPPFLSINLL